MRVVSRVVGAGRVDQWEVEPEVIREAVVNALMHRDYSPQARATQVQVDVFPDRAEVSSPVGLFGNVRLEGLGESGTSSSRNPRLAALLQATGDPVLPGRRQPPCQGRRRPAPRRQNRTTLFVEPATFEPYQDQFA